MKAITVIASPRMEGNCRKIVDSITEGINENNGENKIYYVDKINFYSCRSSVEFICPTSLSVENPPFLYK